ncbi:phosphatase PAP2 family protein [Cyclonatronum proteinivorum]|uniref:hypothetical protein n=1 Tax=Cyclonatronum proteinivorum TaxID=1457365 RepID=UPI000F538724|nr:hypothetical protein [Cyclonatronum proteinivorum]
MHANHHTLAQWISTVFNPLMLVLPLFWLLGRAGHDPGTAQKLLVIAVVFFALLPFGVLLIFLKSKRIESLEIRNRSRRHIPFLVGIVLNIAGFALLMWADGPFGLIQNAAFALLWSSIVASFITLWWKISIHCTAIAIASGYAVWAGVQLFDPAVSVLIGILCLLISGSVVWARITLKAHTPAQTAAGLLFGILVAAISLAFYPV